MYFAFTLPTRLRTAIFPVEYCYTQPVFIHPPMSDSPDSGYSGYCSLSGMIDEFEMENQRLGAEEEHAVIKREIVVHSCHECGLDITDRHLLKVGDDQFWHPQCLRCSQCQTGLDDFGTCFMRNQNIYCRICYTSEFASRCSACQFPITPGDWIRRARDYIYHLACFVCNQCKIPLSTGECFTMLGHHIRCKNHSMKIEGPEGVEQKPIIEDIKSEDASSTGTISSEDTSHSAEGSPPKRKRTRTNFTHHQLNILRSNFELDSIPDATKMQNIADKAGLTKRVTQVWFQNARSRQKQKASIANATSATTNVMIGNFGMAQIMNGSHAVGALKYQQLPQLFNIS